MGLQKFYNEVHTLHTVQCSMTSVATSSSGIPTPKSSSTWHDLPHECRGAVTQRVSGGPDCWGCRSCLESGAGHLVWTTLWRIRADTINPLSACRAPSSTSPHIHGSSFLVRSNSGHLNEPAVEVGKSQEGLDFPLGFWSWPLRHTSDFDWVHLHLPLRDIKSEVLHLHLFNSHFSS